MPISYSEKNGVFKLDTSTSSYLIKVFAEGYLLSQYYGAKIPDECADAMIIHTQGHASFDPDNRNIQFGPFAMSIAPMEYPTSGCGDFRMPALTIQAYEGNTATDLRYDGYRIYPGKPRLAGLPALYVDSDDQADTLEIYMLDRVTGARATLIYTAFRDHGAITRSVVLENTGTKPFRIEQIASASVSLHDSDFDFLHLYGKYFHERNAERFPLHHGTRGVVGERHDDQLGLGGNGRFESVCFEAELILLTAGHMDRYPAGQGGDGLVADKAGLRDDHLIPGLHNGADAHINGFAAAHGHQHLPQGVVVQVHPALQISADLRPQLFQTCVGGVAGAAMLQALDACFPHSPRCFEIRLAHAQTDALGHFGSQIEKFADAGGAHGLSGRRDQFIVVHHSTVHSLSSISSS